MNAKVLLVAALVLCGTCSGCSPIPTQVSPQIHARVIDAQTKQPIGGAEVVVRDFRDSVHQTVLATAHSAADGTVDIAAVKKFDRPLISPGLDSYPIPVMLEIEAPGHEPAQQEIASDKPWTGTIDLRPTR